VRDREPGVRLKERERAVLAQQELARRRAGAARRPQDRRRCGPQPPIEASGQERRGRLLYDLLMAPLQRAVPAGDHRDAAAGVCQALDLDVPRMVQVVLGKALRPAVRGGGRAHGPREGARDLGGRPGDSDAFPPAPGGRLDHHGQPVLACERRHLRGVRGRHAHGRQQRHARLQGRLPGGELVTQPPDR
jgi:hypothetical protein